MAIPPFLRAEAGPTTLKQRPWAGNRLAKLRGTSGPIGESWEFSTLPGSESTALGRPLSNVLGHPLPWLAKLIDTALPLSVQVHPDDDDKTGRCGKEEAWVILDAAPGAHVFAGLAPGVTRGQFEDALLQAQADPAHPTALFSALRRIEVVPGTILVVPAQTVHAIAGGVLLAEIQQPSDCTYRFFDYGRGRALHVDQALATFAPEAQPHVWRPGQEPTCLSAKHVHLQILTRDHNRVSSGRAPRLIICARGQALVRAGGVELRLAAGELLLATRQQFDIEVAHEGVVVVGTVNTESSK